jgi:hypothetical protein
MDKIEKLIEEIGVDCIVNYISNRKIDNSKEIKEFILNEIQSCKIEFCDGGYYLRKDGFYMFKCNFKTGYFFCDYDKIHKVFFEKYKTNAKEINKIIKDMIGRTSKI